MRARPRREGLIRARLHHGAATSSRPLLTAAVMRPRRQALRRRGRASESGRGASAAVCSKAPPATGTSASSRRRRAMQLKQPVCRAAYRKPGREPHPDVRGLVGAAGSACEEQSSRQTCLPCSQRYPRTREPLRHETATRRRLVAHTCRWYWETLLPAASVVSEELQTVRSFSAHRISSRHSPRCLHQSFDARRSGGTTSEIRSFCNCSAPPPVQVPALIEQLLAALQIRIMQRHSQGPPG